MVPQELRHGQGGGGGWWRRSWMAKSPVVSSRKWNIGWVKNMVMKGCYRTMERSLAFGLQKQMGGRSILVKLK